MAHPTLTRGLLTAAAALGAALHSMPAAACGGFFCGRQPVDQTAERILFEVGQDSVTMTTQISYSGSAEDFAWVLPLSAVPDPNSLAVTQLKALVALDANSGPQFNFPDDPACYQYLAVPEEAGGPGVDYDDGAPAGPPPVEVFIRQTVGDYDVAVIESADPAALIAWLRDEGFRITAPMEPFIAKYTSEGLKFLALKLIDAADVTDIKPFRFTLPGTTPTIPLRMTALAAEPEMSILVFVLGDQRFEGKNWPNVAVADDQIRWSPYAVFSGNGNNWASLVAQSVDAAGGQGWVTELAGATANYAEQVRLQVEGGNFATDEDRLAADELLAALTAHPYMTRLYTRLSAEEMSSDPVLGRTSLGDVSNVHQLSRFVNGEDMCVDITSTNPCDFSTCGAGGLCRPVTADAANTSAAPIAGCACVPGATARATFAPDGTPTVICQDGRMSFLNAGDRETPDADVVPDACAGFDCGEHGQCTAVNMTPTCVCDQGYVAVGSIDESGTRSVSCVTPDEAVPTSFYDKRLPALSELGGGRTVDVPSVMPTVPEPTPEDPEPTPNAGFPMPRSNGSTSSGGGCNLGNGSSGAGSTSGAWWLAGLGAVALRRRRPAASTRG